jgi:LPXTG-motif cell wall-anchored protein
VKKVYQWLLMGSLMVLAFCLGVTTYAESKTSQAGITFIGDGSIEVSVILQKRDKETNEVLSDATFELRDEAGKLINVNQAMTTDRKGEIHLTRLLPGKYMFLETKSPKGYQLDQTPIPFEVGFDKTSAKVVAYNQKNKKIEKTEPDKSNSDNTSANESTEKKQVDAKKLNKKLPKAGTKDSLLYAILGILVLVIAIYCATRKDTSE